eukprot:scaffold239174_cov18-Tisochrysis_lutea.AAC.1
MKRQPSTAAAAHASKKELMEQLLMFLLVLVCCSCQPCQQSVDVPFAEAGALQVPAWALIAGAIVMSHDPERRLLLLASLCAWQVSTLSISTSVPHLTRAGTAHAPAPPHTKSRLMLLLVCCSCQPHQPIDPQWCNASGCCQPKRWGTRYDPKHSLVYLLCGCSSLAFASGLRGVNTRSRASFVWLSSFRAASLQWQMLKCNGCVHPPAQGTPLLVLLLCTSCAQALDFKEPVGKSIRERGATPS